MNLINEITLSFSSAGFGAILSTILPGYLRTIEYSKRKDLLENWFSAHENYDLDIQDTWISEEVKISVNSSNLLIESQNNPH